MKKLIVNADDFGLHTAVNKAVIKGYREGCLRSTSFMASGKAAEEAAELARENPGLGVGAHLTLVAEKPVLPPDKVPSLINDEGYFLPDHIAFIKRYVAGGIRMDEVYAECEAQIARIESLGAELSEIDSHQHLHVLPKVIDIAIELGKKHNIHRMRFPGEKCLFTGGFPAPMFRFVAKCGLTFCAEMAARKARNAGFLMPNAFFGMLAGGSMKQEYFTKILESLPNGVSEIMVHPGVDNAALGAVYDWQYHWEQELESVTSEETMKYIAAQGIQLCSFKELSDE